MGGRFIPAKNYHESQLLLKSFPVKFAWPPRGTHSSLSWGTSVGTAEVLGGLSGTPQHLLICMCWGLHSRGPPGCQLCLHWTDTEKANSSCIGAPLAMEDRNWFIASLMEQLWSLPLSSLQVPSEMIFQRPEARNIPHRTGFLSFLSLMSNDSWDHLLSPTELK